METQMTKQEQAAIARYMRQIGSRGGRAAAARLTAKQRRARAVKASRAAARKREAAHA